MRGIFRFRFEGIQLSFGVVHLFDTPFYKATMKVREQLVSKALSPTNIFTWIKEQKENLNLSNQYIHLISGEDDLVVGDRGVERFAEYQRNYLQY